LASIPKDNIDAGRGSGGNRRRTMTDYWLNKLFFDLQQPELAAQYKKDREAVLSQYRLRPELRRAVLADDFPTIAPNVNAYLLRFYFAICGMKDAEFIRRLNELPPKDDAPNKGVPSHG
jgi:hypothetical protein